MAIFKCKMCGGTIEFEQGATVGVCDSCGTRQTLPKLDDDQRANLYGRANHFRRNSDYDKAMGIYEQILNEDKTDAEAYWSIVLCRYGIEYVEDPKTHKRIPTVNRAQYTSIFADADYQSALQYADTMQKSIYEAEAKAIDDIQKGILAISQKEEPFDVFICYKETDEAGQRTPDSVLANDLYHQLVQEGFKVFFSRITLEDKLGSEYEPYIFAALNSAKVMVVLGTRPEYFNAVWVKNEWSRYLTLVKASDGKKMLIPAYKDMDPYDLPDAFYNLQAQDMSKLGFMQDLIRGIRKIVNADEPKPVKETVVVQSSAPVSANVTALMDRGFMALEDGEWDRADGFFEEALNQDAKNALCYLGKLMAELNNRKREDLKDAAEPFDDRNNCKKASRFDAAIAKELADANAYIRKRNETARKEKIYQNAVSDSTNCDSIPRLEAALKEFESIPDYKDARTKADECRKKIEKLKIKQEQEEAERKQREAEAAEAKRIAEEKRKKLIKKVAIIGTPIAAMLIVLLIVLDAVIISVGEIVTFGAYEQDNDTSNGKEDIAWLVLDKQDGKALVISKYALDCQPYNTEYEDVTWQTCTLRTWLNGTFIKDAFSETEQGKILTTTVTADKNPDYSTNPGSDTQDKVFLLSTTEASNYFDSDSTRQCAPTAYAITQGAWTSDSYSTSEGKAACWWWLRSPSYSQDCVAGVHDDGSVYISISVGNVGNDYGAVRPAFWIETN